MPKSLAIIIAIVRSWLQVPVLSIKFKSQELEVCLLNRLAKNGGLGSVGVWMCKFGRSPSCFFRGNLIARAGNDRQVLAVFHWFWLLFTCDLDIPESGVHIFAQFSRCFHFCCFFSRLQFLCSFCSFFFFLLHMPLSACH